MPLAPALRRQRPAWSTNRVPKQPRLLHGKTVSKNQNKFYWSLISQSVFKILFVPVEGSPFFTSNFIDTGFPLRYQIKSGVMKVKEGLLGIQEKKDCGSPRQSNGHVDPSLMPVWQRHNTIHYFVQLICAKERVYWPYLFFCFLFF